MSTGSYRLSAQAEEQFAAILAWSEEQYGPVQASKYEDLLLVAMNDIATNPDRAGSLPIRRSGGIRVYEIRHSRSRLPVYRRIRAPWHKLVYRLLSGGGVEILAILGLSYPSSRAAREAARDC